MKTLVTTALVTATFFSGLQGVCAAEVGGSVKTDVKTAVLLQTNTGIANKNEINLGSITGKSSSVGGDVKMSVKTGAVIQSNKGIANNNEVNLGSITD